MPSVPSRLAAGCVCVLALWATTPALADKDPNKAPPPQPPGLQSPGQGNSSSGGSAPAPQAPAVETAPPSADGVHTNFTPKVKKGKGGGGAAPQRGKGDGSSGSTFTSKQPKPKDASPVTSGSATTSSTPVTTPAGGNTPTPTVPVTPGGSVAAPKHHRHTKRHSAAKTGRRGARSSAPATPRPSAPVTRPVRAVGLAPEGRRATPTSAGHERSRRALARVRVSVVTRTVHDIVQVIPGPVKAVIGAMAALLLAAVAAWTAVTLRSRRLCRQRSELLQEVGLLQAALLPEVPAHVGPLAASVAYRPADGPGAGGDFYDVFQLEDGKVGLVLGDVAGHGRDALARTALLRYTLRAYLETGLEPRVALRLAGETLDHDLDAGFATAAVAMFDPDTGTLTYSCAGHPPPILLGPPAHEPITVCSAPPIGVGERTGVRQTTVALPIGSLACFFTDGLAEARMNGELFGRERLASLIRSLGPDATASQLVEGIRGEVDHLPDDMAACILRPVVETGHGGVSRVEELELRERGERDLRRFLAACGIPAVEIGDLVRSADARAADYGGAVVRVTLARGERPRVSLVLPVIEALGSRAA